jgi:hypothetical protein
LLTSWPVHLSNKSRVLPTLRASSMLALKKRRQSSAKSRFDTHEAPLATFNGVILLSSVSFFRIQVSTLPTKRNKYGLIGSPCLRPLVGRKESCVRPLTLREYLTDLTQDISQVIHKSHKPIFRSAFSGKPRSTLSYAFDRSSFSAR